VESLSFGMVELMAVYCLAHAARDSGYMEGKRVFDFGRSILVCSVNIQNSSIKFVELDAPKKTIEIIRPNNQSHASSYFVEGGLPHVFPISAQPTQRPDAER
jgi:hypothetical protein